MNTDRPKKQTPFKVRYQHMIETLRQRILDGTYPPGDYLPAEKELVSQFDLSNKSVRKGLDVLVEEGLITKIDRVGSRVNAHSHSQITITLGYNHTIERDLSLTSLLEDFQTLHPSIHVRTVPLPLSMNYPQAMKEYMKEGLVDLFTLNNHHFQYLRTHKMLGLLHPLRGEEPLYPFAKNAFSHNQTSYAKPLIFSPLILAYNREHFAEMHLPEPDSSWTWDDAIRIGERLHQPGARFGLYFHLLSDHRWPAFLLQSGASFPARDLQSFSLMASPLMDSIRLCKQIIYNNRLFPGLLMENNDDVNELFIKGKVSMILTNYMTLNELKNTGMDYDISPMPYLHEPNTLLHVIGVAVNHYSAKKEAALLLADYLSSDRAQRIIRQETLSIPARKHIAELQTVSPNAMNMPSRYFLFREVMSSYRLPEALNLSASAFNEFRGLLKQYWAGIIEDEALSEAVHAMLASS